MDARGYTYVKLGPYDFGLFRLGGPGLGNLLFPWARSIVAADKHALLPIWPTWPQLKLGPLLRREPDSRSYSALFSRPRGYVGGFAKARVLARLACERVDGDRLLESDPPLAPARRKVLAVFSGMTSRFASLAGRHELVRTHLLDMLSPRVVVPARRNLPRIAVHVRLGDFGPPPERADGGTGGASRRSNTRLPMAWYVRVVRCVRAHLGEDVPVTVFSDGADAELGELLALPATRRLTFGSAISDLLALAGADVLIASDSTFSMWAAYLGQMPTAWFAGARPQHVTARPEAATEVALDGGPAAAWLDLAAAAIRAAAPGEGWRP